MTWAQWFLAVDLILSLFWLAFKAGRWRDWEESAVANILTIIIGISYIGVTLWALMSVGAFRDLAS